MTFDWGFGSIPSALDLFYHNIHKKWCYEFFPNAVFPPTSSRILETLKYDFFQNWGAGSGLGKNL